uniref:Uncharacterized protein n=1 Tax=Anopheles maculatus TaxID=74869 RepID=A0A182T1F7_9DIPT
MRDFVSLFGSQYQTIFGGGPSCAGGNGGSLGSSSGDCCSSSGGSSGTPQRRRSVSLGPFRRRIRSEFSLLDYFFHQPKHGRHTRYPNRKYPSACLEKQVRVLIGECQKQVRTAPR